MCGTPVVRTLPSNAQGTGSIPGRGARSLMPHCQKKKKKKSIKQRYCKSSVDFKNGPHLKKSLKINTKGKGIQGILYSTGRSAHYYIAT